MLLPDTYSLYNMTNYTQEYYEKPENGEAVTRVVLFNMQV